MSLVGGDGDDMSDGRGAFAAHISFCGVVVVDVVGMIDVGGVVSMVDVGGSRESRFVLLELDVR